jgi:hypothetical protein
MTERDRIKALEREVRELRQANEILKEGQGRPSPTRRYHAHGTR